MSAPGIFLGIDFGTSGARAIAISADRQVQATASLKFDAASKADWAAIWRQSLFALIAQMPLVHRQEIRAIAINGTSSTVMICDAQGQLLDAPILYNDARGATVLEAVRAIAPMHHTVVSATSSLAKLLWWKAQIASGTLSVPATPYFLHQADWLAFWLHGKLGISDYHNALKLGYDVAALTYPDWLTSQNLPFRLPDVVTPGRAIAPITLSVATQLALPSSCLVCAGTTDSIAAFLASGAQAPGEAVTSLGSTLVLKLLSESRVDDARYGIYSHRLENLWLVGGASNTGGAVLRQFFSESELDQLSQQIDPAQDSKLDYYPLTQPGERFPINDPQLLPRLSPRPDHPAEFLQGLLSGIARIEASGYELLQALGATPLRQVYTAGGGAKNPVWQSMRSRYLQVPVIPSAQSEAAYGTALLALQGYINAQ
ncbi:MAG TPA: FGGY-family carbohydrate kinase [Coleofasciculaceae cyanobacterium]|jgi:xylulokinase